MAQSTEELELFKYDEVADASQVFSFEQALNDNWDKIDSFAGAIKSLSNLDAQGEKRFEDIWTELDKKLEAEVLLSENGYIKFNNDLVLQWNHQKGNGTCYFPRSFNNIPPVTFISLDFTPNSSVHSGGWCAHYCLNTTVSSTYVYNIDGTTGGYNNLLVIGY